MAELSEAELRAKAEANAAKAKEFLERQYSTIQRRVSAREDRRQWLESSMAESDLSARERIRLRREWAVAESSELRRLRTRTTVADFEKVRIIGRGAFGEVTLVRENGGTEIFAMKKLSKEEMRRRGQVDHARTERDVMAAASSSSVGSNFLVQLRCSFQDDENLYLVMRFYPGGDFMTLLMRMDVLPEDWVRFYAAELVVAVAAMHQRGFIHRDLKPDNIIFDENGLSYLSDFGLATSGPADKYRDNSGAAADRARRLGFNNGDSGAANDRSQVIETWRKNRRVLAHSTVGTPDYIAPEVLAPGADGYGPEADWWSLGAIVFEALFGYPPFCAGTPQETCQRILRWQDTLQLPANISVSPAARDFVRRLMCDAPRRLGRGGVREIQQHSFFRGIDWTALTARTITPPFKPTVNSPDDTQNFDEFSDHEDAPAPAPAPVSRDLDFAGYTFKPQTSVTEFARRAGLTAEIDGDLLDLDERSQITTEVRRPRPSTADLFGADF